MWAGRRMMIETNHNAYRYHHQFFLVKSLEQCVHILHQIGGCLGLNDFNRPTAEVVAMTYLSNHA